jgi:hypothetical protein
MRLYTGNSSLAAEWIFMKFVTAGGDGNLNKSCKYIRILTKIEQKWGSFTENTDTCYSGRRPHFERNSLTFKQTGTCQQMSLNSPTSHFAEIRSAVLELLHAARRTDNTENTAAVLQSQHVTGLQGNNNSLL